MSTGVQNPNPLRKRSRFTGVVWSVKNRNPARGAWKARIMVNGKMHHLGYFKDEEEAARAYDRAIIKFRGERLKMNFPGGDDVSN